MNIPTNNYNIQASNNVNFRGLTSKLSSSLYSREEVKALYKKYSAKSPSCVGRLPHEWIQNIPYDKRKNNICDIFQQFGTIISQLRCDNSQNCENNIINALKQLFLKTNVLQKSDDLSLKYVGKGMFSKVYKLTLLGKDYALKIFNSVENGDMNSLSMINGNFYEQAIGQYVKKKIPLRSKNIAFMHFGDMKNGIQLSEFCDRKTTYIPKRFDYDKIGLEISEREHYRFDNNIGNKIIDFGCMKLLYKINNKYLMFLHKNMDSNREKIENFVSNTLSRKPSADFDKRVIGIYYLINSYPNIVNFDSLKIILQKIGTEAAEFISFYLENIQEAQRTYVFGELLKRDEHNVNVNLAKNILLNTYCIEKDKPDFFNFMKTMSNVLDINMSKLHSRREYGLMQFYDELLSKNSVEVNASLSKALEYLPKENLENYYEPLCQNSNEQVRNNLTYNIQYLPKQAQDLWIKRLAKYNDKEFFKNLYDVYPLETRYELVKRSFEILLGEVESTLLASQLSKLKQKDLDYWFTKFYALQQENVNEILRENVYNLPISKLEVWESRLFN